ncbi:hypothetical protein [Haloferula sp.]|uniref:hypothetical protein n=1 Tax=Haloferula sp. TaxID=2497595 RepID=UPI00329ABDD7
MRLAGISLIAVVNLTSCVGGGLVVGEKNEHSEFGINATRSTPLRRVVAVENGGNPTRKEITSRWGEPDRRSSEGGEERWTYQSGLALRGAIPMLGIGIPLVIPVGKNRYEFFFPTNSDRSHRLTVTDNQMTGGYFGVSSFSESKGFGYHRLGE